MRARREKIRIQVDIGFASRRSFFAKILYEYACSIRMDAIISHYDFIIVRRCVRSATLFRLHSIAITLFYRLSTAMPPSGRFLHVAPLHHVGSYSAARCAHFRRRSCAGWRLLRAASPQTSLFAAGLSCVILLQTPSRCARAIRDIRSMISATIFRARAAVDL